MEVIIALSITGLFAYWIRILKHEVWNLRQQLYAAAVGGKGRLASNVVIVPSHDSPASIKDPGAVEGNASLFNRKSPETEGGIPTWTLR